jgi:pseudouridine synthase
VRLNKYLADRGVGARRKCDALIAEGRVRVNGEPVTEPGMRIEEQRDRVTVDGKPVQGRSRLAYYVLNKPVGVITTLDDPQGRRTVGELLPRGARVYPVGRLDADTSGLLVLTNDGELAHRLMHPRYGVVKVYRVRLAREPGPEQLRRLATGVRFEPGRVSAPARVRRVDPGFDAIMIELAIHEGRFRQVRRMCEAVGLEVTGLHRVGYGPLRLGPLARGMFRELSAEEVARLRAAAARPTSAPRPTALPRARALPPARARHAGGRPAEPRGRSGATPAAGRPRPAGRRGRPERGAGQESRRGRLRRPG